MSQKFKVGDRVICIDDSNMTQYIIKLGTYTVVGYHNNHLELYLKGIMGSFYENRFELESHPSLPVGQQLLLQLPYSLNVGDRIRVVKAKSLASMTSVGDLGTIVHYTPGYNPSIRMDKGGPDWIVEPSSIEVISLNSHPYLTPGICKPSHIGDDYAVGLREMTNQPQKELFQPGCDCGGFKTYQSMTPECHSTWCKSKC